MGIPVPPLLCPDKGYFCLISTHDALPFNLIEDLPMAYTAVASDISNEKEVWMNSGRFFDAIRASISLLLIFSPFRYQGVDLIDGGVLNPVPIAPTFGDATDMAIAVNLGGKVDNREQRKVERYPAIDSQSPMSRKISQFIESFTDSPVVKIGNDRGVYDIADQAFDAMQSTIARQKLAAYPADHFIEIARNACGTLEFDRAVEMIDLGSRRAEDVLA